MASCEYCGKEFNTKRDLHAHWKKHESELNSHQRDKMKKAVRKQKESDREKVERRRNLAFKGLAGLLGLAIILLVGSQFIHLGGEKELGSQPVMGNESAPVTVIEFGDYRCPYCAQFETRVFPKLRENYIETGKVKYHFVNYAFLGDGSKEAAVAGECVNKQSTEQFWDFHHALYENQGPESERWVNTGLLMDIAKNSTEGLDYKRLQSCIEDRETAGEVARDLQVGRSMGVTSTPSVFVNGEPVKDWSYPGISRAIDAELETQD